MDDLIGNSHNHRTVDGDKLVKLRQRLGFNQAKFARIAGWSQQRQSELEVPGKHEIKINIADTITEIAVSGNTTV
jgi:DNA-binding XRE family transcriptional regulator